MLDFLKREMDWVTMFRFLCAVLLSRLEILLLRPASKSLKAVSSPKNLLATVFVRLRGVSSLWIATSILLGAVPS